MKDVLITALSELQEPYLSGNLLYLWTKWGKDKSLHKIFWWRVSSRNDVISLPLFFEEMTCKQGRYLHLIHHTDPHVGIMGAFWVYDIHLPHHISAGIWLDFRFRAGLDGIDSEVLGKYALDWVGDIYKPKHLFMYSPWADAVALARRVGVPVVAAIDHATELTKTGKVYVMRKDY